MKLSKEKWNKLIRQRDKFYEKNRLAIPENISKVECAVRRAIEKRGHKPYEKNRDRASSFLKRLFRKYHLKGTTTESFWKTFLLSQLIGPSKQYLESLRQLRIVSKTNDLSSPKSKHKRHRRVK